MRRRPSFTRADRLGALMRDEVERIVDYEVHAAIVRHVQVTESVLSGDLGHLRVRYVMKASDEPSAKAQDALERAAGFVARTLTDSLQLHRTPKVVFSFDREFVRMRRMKAALDADRAARGEAPLLAERLDDGGGAVADGGTHGDDWRGGDGLDDGGLDDDAFDGDDAFDDDAFDADAFDDDRGDAVGPA
jgi:ribosome-binding factor A